MAVMTVIAVITVALAGLQADGQIEHRWRARVQNVAECRNWQTNQTQNLAYFSVRVGSSLTSATSTRVIASVINVIKKWPLLSQYFI